MGAMRRRNANPAGGSCRRTGGGGTRRHPAAAALLISLAVGACAGAGGEMDLPPLSMTPERPPVAGEPADLENTPPPTLDAPELAAGTQPPPAPRTLTQPPGGEAPPPLPGAQPAASPGAEATASSRGKGKTIVISAAQTEGELTRQQLLAASVEERQRRTRSEQPVVVVTNENLAESAKGGQITIAEVVPENPPERSAEEDDPEAPERNEEYWRARALAARVAWRDALDRVDELESEVAALRQRFYAEDDPYFRDNEIKPAWDRALENLERQRALALRSRDDLDGLLEEGRRAGALPGWLREGLELEPEREPAEDEERDPLEPDFVDEDEWNDR